MRKLILLLSLLPLIALADETPDADHPRFAVAVCPAWVHVLRDNYSSAFSANGFNTPGRDRVSLDLLAYWTTESAWQLGLGMTSLSLEQDNGTAAADYSNNIFGFYVARNLSENPDHDFTLGSLFGITSSELNIFTPSRSGRLRENAALVAPSVGYAARVSHHAKLGVRASYLVPFGESSQLNGQDLAVNKIAVRGFTLSALLVFGRF